MEKVYIAGAITNNPSYKEQFDNAEKTLRSKGYKNIINPTSYGEPEDYTWTDYMRRGIKMLCDCNIIVLLPGWKSSDGANIEINIAKALKFKIYELKNDTLFEIKQPIFYFLKSM